MRLVRFRGLGSSEEGEEGSVVAISTKSDISTAQLSRNQDSHRRGAENAEVRGFSAEENSPRPLRLRG